MVFVCLFFVCFCYYLFHLLLLLGWWPFCFPFPFIVLSRWASSLLLHYREPTTLTVYNCSPATSQSLYQSDRRLRKGHGWVTTADAFKAETGFGVTFSLSQCINITWFVWRPFDFEWLRARVANMLILCIKTGSAARVSRAMKIVCQQS